MKLRTARLGVLLIAVVGLTATAIPPASATTYKLITFTATMALSRGLGYPCIPLGTLDCITAATTVKVGPKHEPQVNLTPGGNTAGFGLGTVLCIKASVSTPDKKTPKDGVDLCTMVAAGVVTGFCDLATGQGVATMTNTTGTITTKTPISTAFKFTDVGGVFHVSGGDKATNFYAEMWVFRELNSPGGPSCTNKTATRFNLTGVGVYKDCTSGTTISVCNP